MQLEAKVPEILEADEAGETGGQRGQGLVCHVEDLCLENGSHRSGFQ